MRTAWAGGLEIPQPEEAEYHTLNELADRVATLRPVSGVAVRVLALTDEPAVSAHELADVMSADQALSAKMLRMANSAYYGHARRISSVRDAVVLLGSRTVRSAVLVSTVMNRSAQEGLIGRYDFWRYCVAVGISASSAAQRRQLDKHMACTAGVLHAISVLALDRQTPELLWDAVSLAREGGIALRDAELALFGYTDADLGRELALRWNFPQELVDSIGAWPAPPESQPGTIAEVLHYARELANACGLAAGIETAKPPDDDEIVLPEIWQTSPWASALTSLGGPEGIIEKADSFVEATLLV
ncbi:MAG: HDOD domain-containing protein [Dehalococcoidia bacterium]|nr:HDOD domain-containing protein [Dehalococcoidia bacterium]